MTAKASTKAAGAVNPALHNWKCITKEHMKLMIILTILHVFAMPAIIISLMASIYTEQQYDAYVDVYSVIGIFTTAIGGFMGIFAAVGSFKCLNDKSLVDMKLALPMNAKERFLSNFLSGLFAYVAPFLSAQVISVLLIGYGNIFMDGKTFFKTGWDNVLDIPTRTPYVCDIFGEITPMYFKLLTGGLLCMLMLYVTTVFITVCCGSKFEAISYTIIYNIILPITIFCVFFAMLEGLYGIDFEDISYDILLHTTLAGGIAFTAIWATDEIEYMYNGMGIVSSVAQWLIIFSLIIIGFFILTFFLYKKRRAEQVSKPFVFKIIYYILLTCGIFSITSVLTIEGGIGILPTIIITAIIYMIFEVITNRGFKRFWLSIIKYAATFIAVIGLIVIAKETEGFGSVYRIPSVSSVESVICHYNGFYENMSINSQGIVFKDPENIKTIVDVHQIILDRHKESPDNNYYAVQGFDITYKLKSGISYTRSYYMIPSEADQLIYKLDFSDEYKNQLAHNAKENILGIKEKYATYIENYDYADADNFRTYVRPNCYQLFTEDSLTKIPVRVLIDRGFYDSFAEAYSKDILAITEESWYHSDYRNSWYLNTNLGGSYFVPESFENSIAVLNKFDFGLERIEDFTDDELEAYIMLNNGLKLYTADEWCEFNNVNDKSMIFSYYSYYGQNYDWNDNPEIFVYDYTDDVLQLVRESKPMNIVPDDGYIIVMADTPAVVPEELNDVAASILRTSRDDERARIQRSYAYQLSGVKNPEYYYD